MGVGCPVTRPSSENYSGDFSGDFPANGFGPFFTDLVHFFALVRRWLGFTRLLSAFLDITSEEWMLDWCYWGN